MKKKLTIILTALLCCILVAFTFVGCDKKNETKEISYTGGTLENGWVGVSYTGNVAKATGPSNISYAIKEGSVSLPNGLALSSDGEITGMPTAESDSTEITVIASASGVASVEAKFTIKIGGLTMNEKDSITGRRYTPITSKIIKIKNDIGDVEVTYALKEGSNPLPAGITLLPTGTLMGTPTEIVSNHQCVIVASATGFTSAEQVITFNFRRESEVEGSGAINNFVEIAIPDAYQNDNYTRLSAVKTPAVSATNNAPVLFKVKDESALPTGFSLTEGGDLMCSGKVSAPIGTYNFVVIASAKQCPDVEATFSIKVNAEKLIAHSVTLPTATVKTAYSASLVTKTLTDKYPNLTFTFAVDKLFVNNVPKGLSLSSAGLLTGTPEKSIKKVTFKVIVSAPGYSNGIIDAQISVRDGMEAVTNGIFDAELVDMQGLAGAGSSNNPIDEGLVQRAEDENVDSSYNGFFVGYTNAKILLKFNFTASAAASGVRMSLSLASENGELNFASSGFLIRVNGGAPLSYSSFKVDGTKTSGSVFSAFKEYNISTTFALKEGDNTIELEISNAFLDTNNGKGPAIDYMKLTNFNSTLNWAPHKYNLVQPDRWES